MHRELIETEGWKNPVHGFITIKQQRYQLIIYHTHKHTHTHSQQKCTPEQKTENSSNNLAKSR